MKLQIVLAVLVLGLASVARSSKRTGETWECEKSCAPQFDPICGHDSNGNLKNFYNECHMETINCLDGLDYTRKNKLWCDMPIANRLI